MSKPSAPAAPDYAAAADRTAASQRVNYSSPWGSINWSPPPSTQPGGQPTMGGPMNQPTSAGRAGRLSYDGRSGRLDDGPGSPGDTGSGDGTGAGDGAGSGGSDGGGGGGGPSGPSDPGDPGGVGGPSGPGGNMGGGYVTQPGQGVGAQPNLMPWTQTLTLSPEQQRLLDAQNQTSLGLAGLQGQGVDAVRGVFNNMPSASQLTPNAINPGQTAQDAIMARVQPMLNRQQDRMANQLANQGIQVGSQAYSDAQRDFGQQANDAYSQAGLQGIDLAQRARQQGMAEQGFYSQMPINLLNAVRQGSQVQTPQSGSQGPAANYLGAAQAQGQAALGQYGADVGQYNNTLGTLGTIAAAMF